jgi:hypothetical protein
MHLNPGDVVAEPKHLESVSNRKAHQQSAFGFCSGNQ